MSIKISELPAATSVGNNDVLPIVQSGTTKKAAASLLKTTISSTINSSSTNTTAAGSKAVYDYSAPISHSTSATTYGVGTSSNYGHCKTINNLTTASYVAGEALSAYQGKVLDDAKEDVANKTGTIDENSTSTQYPNAEATYQAISNLEGNLSAEISDLQAENEALRNQIPTYTATGTTINVKDSSNLPIKDFALLGNASQNGTPTPDSPVPIQVVTGDNTINIIKNLWGGFTAYTSTSYQVAYTTNADGTITANGTSNNNNSVSVSVADALSNGLYKELPAGTYEIYGGKSSAKRLQIFDENSTNYGSDEGNGKTITINDTKKIIVRVNIASGTNCNNEVFNIRVYNSAEIQTQLISLGDIELAKIGTYQDRIYKSSGKWYLYKEIGKQVFDGTENIWNRTIQGDKYCYWFRNTTFQALPKKYDKLCKYFTYTSSAYQNAPINSLAENDATAYETSFMFIYVTDGTQGTTIDTWKSWLSEHNMPTYFVNKTPITTEITDTTLIQQLDNVLAMNTYKNETNAFSIVASGNEEAELQIEYYQDIATLFNNLSNAIISLGGNV